MKKEYNKAFIILYDEDEKLFYCKVGLTTEKNSPLHYTVWGKSESECNQRAKQLVTILHNAQSINKAALI